MTISSSTYYKGKDTTLILDIDPHPDAENSEFLSLTQLNADVSLSSSSVFKTTQIVVDFGSEFKDVMKLTTDDNIYIENYNKSLTIKSIKKTLLRESVFTYNLDLKIPTISYEYNSGILITKKIYNVKIKVDKVINILGFKYEVTMNNKNYDVFDLYSMSNNKPLDEFLKDGETKLNLELLNDFSAYLDNFNVTSSLEKQYIHNEKLSDSPDIYPTLRKCSHKINIEGKIERNVGNGLIKFDFPGEGMDNTIQSTQLLLNIKRKQIQKTNGSFETVQNDNLEINLWKQKSEWPDNPSKKHISKGEYIGSGFINNNTISFFDNDTLNKVVNEWIKNPESNYGFYIEAKLLDFTDAEILYLEIDSFEAQLIKNRPRLILTEEVEQVTPWSNIIMDGPFDGTFYTKPYEYIFPAGTEPWAGFAYATANTNPISFPLGGTITFKAFAETNTNIKFKFERLPYNAEGNEAADTEPWFETDSVEITTVEKEYTIYIQTQGENTFSSFLLFLESNDVTVTLSDLNVNNYKKYEDKIENVDYKQHTDGVKGFTTTNLIITTSDTTYNPSWYGATDIIDWEEGLTKPTPACVASATIVRDSRFVNADGSLKSKEDMKQYINEYMNLMESKVCVFNPKYNTIYIRDAVEADKYYLDVRFSIANYHEVHFLPEATQELFGVEDHNDIEIPKKT